METPGSVFTVVRGSAALLIAQPRCSTSPPRRARTRRAAPIDLVVHGCGCHGREPGISRPARPVAAAAELTAMAVLPAVTFPGVHVTFPASRWPLWSPLPRPPPVPASWPVFVWWIRAWRWIECTGMHQILHGARIHHNLFPGRRTTGPAGAVRSHGDRGSRRSWPGRQGRRRAAPWPSPLPRHQGPREGKGSSLAAQPHPPPGHTHRRGTPTAGAHPRMGRRRGGIPVVAGQRGASIESWMWTVAPTKQSITPYSD